MLIRPIPTERQSLVRGELIDPDWYRYLKDLEIILTTGSLSGLAGLDTAVGLVVQQTAAYAFVKRVLGAGSAALAWTNPDGVTGNPSIDVSLALAALHTLGAGATPGLIAHTGANAVANRSLVAPAAGLTISNPAGTAGDPTFALANDLAAVEGLGGTGIAVRTAADTWAQRTLQQPAAGIAIANPAGVAGDPTFALANDLAAIEALNTNGVPVRTGTDTWAANNMLSSTNGQITFPATQAASAGANVLDDYEEGTWTPAWSASGSTFAYTTQYGAYTKIGNLVRYNFHINLATAGNTLTANQLTLTGLPFSSDGNNHQGASVGWNATTTSYTYMHFNTTGGTVLTPYGMTAAGTSSTSGTVLANAALHATNGTHYNSEGTYNV